QIMNSAHTSEGGPMAAAWSIAMLVVGSTVVFAELQSALNHIWDVQADPAGNAVKGFIRGRLLSFAVVLGVGFLLLVSLLISAALSGAEEYIAWRIQGIPAVWSGVHLVVSFLIIT